MVSTVTYEGLINNNDHATSHNLNLFSVTSSTPDLLLSNNALCRYGKIMVVRIWLAVCFGLLSTQLLPHWLASSPSFTPNLSLSSRGPFFAGGWVTWYRLGYQSESSISTKVLFILVPHSDDSSIVASPPSHNVLSSWRQSQLQCEWWWNCQLELWLLQYLVLPVY